MRGLPKWCGFTQRKPISTDGQRANPRPERRSDTQEGLGRHDSALSPNVCLFAGWQPRSWHLCPAPKGMRPVRAEAAHHCASCVHEHLRWPDHKQATGPVGTRCAHSTRGPRVNWESRGPDFPSPVRILASEPTADYLFARPLSIIGPQGDRPHSRKVSRLCYFSFRLAQCFHLGAGCAGCTILKGAF